LVWDDDGVAWLFLGWNKPDIPHQLDLKTMATAWLIIISITHKTVSVSLKAMDDETA